MTIYNLCETTAQNFIKLQLRIYVKQQNKLTSKIYPSTVPNQGGGWWFTTKDCRCDSNNQCVS